MHNSRYFAENPPHGPNPQPPGPNPQPPHSSLSPFSLFSQPWLRLAYHRAPSGSPPALFHLLRVFLRKATVASSPPPPLSLLPVSFFSSFYLHSIPLPQETRRWCGCAGELRARLHTLEDQPLMDPWLGGVVTSRESAAGSKM